MGKSSKTKKEGEEAKDGNDKTDIFKLIFGRDTGEEPGLGLVFHSNPKNEETEVTEKKNKRNKKKGRAHDSDDDDKSNSIEEVVDVKKRKRDKGKEIHLGIESIGSDEGKKRKKEKDAEEPSSGIVSIEERSKRDNEKDGVLVKSEEKKKKRKRDEIEEAYESRMYGVDTKVEGKGDDGVGKRVGEKRKTMDDPAELMESKEGFDDESKLLRTVFVGNLPLKIKKKVLLKEFSRFGEVESLRIRSVPILDSKVPRKGAIIKGNVNETVDSVNAYIVFKEEQSAKAALTNNMAMVGGNHVRVDMACPPRKKLKGDDSPLYDNKRTVFVGNIPFDVKDEELYQLFCGLNQLESSIEAVRVIRDPHTSMGKGIAYVLLKTKEAASLLVKRRHLKLRDRELRLYPAKQESTLPKKRNVSLTSGDHSSAKRLAVASSGNILAGNRDKPKATLSYQGLRASKSGIQKKEFSHKRTGSDGGMQKSGTESGPARKVRSSKRPAVAARKSKELRLASAPGGPREMGTKRKMESRTPEKFNRNKKPRQFR